MVAEVNCTLCGCRGLGIRFGLRNGNHSHSPHPAAKKTAPRGGREIVLIFWSRQLWMACLLVVTWRLDPASSGGAGHSRRIAALVIKNAVICLNEV